MTKKELKKWLPEINHFAKNGNLWYYSEVDKKWYQQTNLILISNTLKIINIIEDRHFKIRKAFALGKKIETDVNNTGVWKVADKIDYDIPPHHYRQKPKEIYEWQWLYPIFETSIFAITEHRTIDEATKGHQKFEPSKRLRK